MQSNQYADQAPSFVMSDSKYNNFPDASYGGVYKNAGALNENSNMIDSDMGDNIY